MFQQGSPLATGSTSSCKRCNPPPLLCPTPSPRQPISSPAGSWKQRTALFGSKIGHWFILRPLLASKIPDSVRHPSGTPQAGPPRSGLGLPPPDLCGAWSRPTGWAAWPQLGLRTPGCSCCCPATSPHQHDPLTFYHCDFTRPAVVLAQSWEEAAFVEDKVSCSVSFYKISPSKLPHKRKNLSQKPLEFLAAQKRL